GVEGVHALWRRSGETEVQAGLHIGRHRVRRRTDPERDRSAPVAQRVLALAEALVTERLERRVIEALGRGDIADADRDMADHLVCSSGIEWKGHDLRRARKSACSCQVLPSSRERWPVQRIGRDLGEAPANCFAGVILAELDDVAVAGAPDLAAVELPHWVAPQDVPGADT